MRRFIRSFGYILSIIVLLTTQQAAATTQDSVDCATLQGGTCFQRATDCNPSGSSTVSDATTTSSGASISGNLQSLAQQITSNKNISFDYGKTGPTYKQFDRLAQGEKAQTDDGRDVDVQPIVLVTILHMAQNHKVNVSALTDGDSHTSASNPHGAGDAADINIFDGSHTNGTDDVAKSIMSSAAEVLPEGARFGLGDNGGDATGSVHLSGKNFGTFADHPTHVHFDVLGVKQSADDAAVAAAGAGSSTPATATTPAASSNLTNNGSVVVIGDSISVRAQSEITQAFQSKNIPVTIDGSSGRALTQAGSDGNKLSGIDAINQDANAINAASAIVVELGTNGGDSADNIGQAIKAIGAGKQVFWVDTIGAGSSDDTRFGATNRTIYAQASVYDYKVVSWFNAVDPSGDAQNPSSKESDDKGYIDNSDGLGVHPTDAGSTALANLIVGAVSGTVISANANAASACCPNGTSAVDADTTDDDAALSGSTNAQKAYNYFTQTRGLSAQAASGIVGNMMVESGSNTENLDTHAHNNISGTHDGIVQWSGSRWSALQTHERGKNIYAMSTQLDYVWYELQGSYPATLKALKTASSPEDAASMFNNGPPVPAFEASGPSGNETGREQNARKIFVKYGGGSSAPAASATTATATSGASCATNGSDGTPTDTTDANMMKTVTVSTPGKFITLPSHYSCPGRTTKIDSRIAADIAYLADHFNLCADDGLASGHKSHGAGVAVDMVPRNGNGKDDWKNSAEAAARAMGWFGDGANQAKGTVNGCAKYVAGEYGQCMHQVFPDKFPQWVRWLGYNGDFQHGDPWHIYGGAFPHIHIGWDTPNHDGVSPTVISSPRQSVYAFPAPVPDDLKDLVN